VLGRATYTSLRDVPTQVDLAIIATSFSQVPRSVEDCIAHGVKGIVIITAGFSETGPEGRALEEELVACCREHGIRIIGSNCMGLYVRRSQLNALGMVSLYPLAPSAWYRKVVTLACIFACRPTWIALVSQHF